MKPTEKLLVYRRHGKDCEVHKTGLSETAKRYYMDCDCTIWVVGRTPQGHIVPRQSTGARAIEDADLQVKAIIAKSNAMALEDSAKLSSDSVHGPTIADCASKYLASRKHELKNKTYQQTDLLLRRLREYCALTGVDYMADVNVDLLESFKVEGLPEMQETSKSTAVAKLRRFLRDAYRRGWTRESLAEKVRSLVAQFEQKTPFTDEEVDKILDEALKLKGGTHGYAKQPKTFRLLLELMLETGMRVGDAILYNPAHCRKGQALWCYTFMPQKQKRAAKEKTTDVYLTGTLKTAIDTCTWLSPRLPFHFGASKNPAYLGNECYERMKAVGSRCGVEDCRPHRLRDTFAVRKLLAGIPLEDVSRLLGHSSVKVTETYYARWVEGRRLRLERLLAESLVNS